MVATACVEQMCVLNGCMLCHGAELSAIVRGCPVWVGPHVVHPFTHSVITIHEFSCSCIRCSSCTHLLTLVCIQSCNFISCRTTSCHAMFNSAHLGSFIHLLHTRTHTLCSMTLTSPGQPWDPFCRQGCNCLRAALAQEDGVLDCPHRPPRPFGSPDACCWWQDRSKPG